MTEQIDVPALRAELSEAVEFGNIEAVVKICRIATQAAGNTVRWTPINELARRADRALGILVRRGQSGPDAYIRVRGDNGAHNAKVSTMNYFSSTEHRRLSFIMTDDVTDEQFELALANARAASSLSRESVAALCSANARVRKSAADDRPELLRKSRRHDIRRVVEGTVATVDGVSSGLRSLGVSQGDLMDLDPDEALQWFKVLDRATRDLGRLKIGLRLSGSRASLTQEGGTEGDSGEEQGE